jgi:hypothetical protein
VGKVLFGAAEGGVRLLHLDDDQGRVGPTEWQQHAQPPQQQLQQQQGELLQRTGAAAAAAAAAGGSNAQQQSVNEPLAVGLQGCQLQLPQQMLVLLLLLLKAARMMTHQMERRSWMEA